MLKKDSIAVLKYLIPEKNFSTFSWLLKFLPLKKGSITSLRLRGFDFEKRLHHILMTPKKFFKIAILWNAGEQPLLKFAYHIIFMINKLHLLWVSSSIALGIYFLFGTKFSWNEGTDTCFNVEKVLLGRNFIFLIVTARYLVITTGYCSLLVVTARHRPLPLIPTFRMNEWN